MMETRFIDGGEYVDRQTYLIMRNINSQLRERIAELEAENKMLHRSLAAKPDTATSSGAAQAAMEYEIDLREQRIKELEAENTRIVAESKQCHETNDSLCSEHMELRKRIAELQTQAANYEYNAAQIITAQEALIEALIREIRQK